MMEERATDHHDIPSLVCSYTTVMFIQLLTFKRWNIILQTFSLIYLVYLVMFMPSFYILKFLGSMFVLPMPWNSWSYWFTREAKPTFRFWVGFSDSSSFINHTEMWTEAFFLFNFVLPFGGTSGPMGLHLLKPPPLSILQALNFKWILSTLPLCSPPELSQISFFITASLVCIRPWERTV